MPSRCDRAAAVRGALQGAALRARRAALRARIAPSRMSA